ncbi:MAG: integrase family protein [Rickettsiales bacterium]|jgi:integrase|nr:integrase family protein [Rickettsiales bacterium]
MTQQFFFYPHILDNLQIPERGFDVCQDMGDKRLRLYITARGIKTFFTRKRVKGRDVRIILGNYPNMSIDEAREKVISVLQSIASPAETKRKRIRFARAVRMFMAEKIHRVEKSRQKLARAVETLWRPLLDKYLNEITADELVGLNEDIARNHGAATANRMREIIKSLFNFAILKNWVSKNPALGIKPVDENRRRNNLTMKGLRKILSKIKREKNYVLKNAFLMLVFGFMRKSDVFSMNWNDLDMKNYFYKSMPLTDKAAVLLQNISQSGKWVFPNGHGGHIVDPRVSWQKIAAASGLPDAQINDCTKLLRNQLKWSNQPEVLRENMNAVLEQLG